MALCGKLIQKKEPTTVGPRKLQLSEVVLADTTVSISFDIFDKHPQILCGMCLQIKSCASVGLEKQQENPHYL